MRLKSGFNLAELLIFLIIVSIVLVATFTTVRPWKIVKDKNVRYRYSAVYDALNMSLYDIVFDDEKNPFKAQNDDAESFNRLCYGLTEYINTTDENCSLPPIPSNVALMQDEDFDFKTLQPHFTSLNGMNFYISSLIKDTKTPNTTKSYYNPLNPNFNLEFFLVYVDINGKEDLKRPHTIKYDPTGKNHPSVFAFAILPTGDAIPIGLAEYNIKYFQTRVSYRYKNSTYFSPYYSYHHAKHAAWDTYRGVMNPMQIAKHFREKISFTYNDAIKEILKRNRSEMYNFNNSGEFPERYSESRFAKCFPPAGTALTSYDLCTITVDTPNFGATH